MNLPRGGLGKDPRVCKAHFTEADYFPWDREKLRPNAVPSLRQTVEERAAPDNAMEVCGDLEVVVTPDVAVAEGDRVCI